MLLLPAMLGKQKRRWDDTLPMSPLLASTLSSYLLLQFSPLEPSPPAPSSSNIGNGMAQAFDMKDASVHPKKPLKMLTHV